MISITLLPNSFTIQGHADYAQHGSDIVCSAVSALSQTALLGFKKYGNVREKLAIGFLDVEFYTAGYETEIIYTVMKLGLHQIASQYPQYVKIMEEL